ncbi:uncharacterized protein METZ01_LOCUS166836 [marine metagenome]|uniref:Uncharacterized protein n=1 Tax=marine metagenome TaxID=408172 RepID=A0A382BKZ7_9ZZZZ
MVNGIRYKNNLKFSVPKFIALLKVKQDI